MPQTWSFTQVQGWQGLKPTNRENTLIQKPLKTKFADPPGWDSSMLSKSKVDELVNIQNSAVPGQADKAQIAAVRDKRAWNISLGPVKGLPMTCFMMYMVGNQVGIFQIMMLGMQFMNTLTQFTQFSNVVKQFEGNEQKILMTLIWILGNGLLVSICVWRCNSMGLLPMHPSDWLTFSTPPEGVEFSSENFL